jgi:prepilin-type N-terminal cleavage/methylation domain-containing protein/prepilin-type processing-associated H-X9-DG protein
MKRPHHSRGFTLVEILVCTTILGLLVGVSGAAYQKAMGKASLASEVNAGKNLVQAYLFAATESEGRYLAAYDSAARNQTVMNAKGRPLGMSEARCRYPFRLAPYFNHQMDGTILVNRNEAQIIQIMGPSGTMYDYGLSVFPAFGINRYLVGGRVNSSGSVEYPSECIQRAAQAEKSPIVFISAGTTDVDGYEYVTAPMGPGGQWSSVKWSKGVDAANYGHVDGRYDGKAICAFLDGSVKVLSIDELRDMRLWSRNAALENNPNYQPK